MIWEHGNEVAIWGAGQIGKKVYLKYRSKYKVKCFVDNYVKNTKINGIDVVAPDSIDKKTTKIIIGVEKNKEICKQCNEMGLICGIDYVPYDFLDTGIIDFEQLYECCNGDKDHGERLLELLLEGRGVALCIGNCQTIEIKKIMARDLDFCKDYLFVSVPSVHLVTADKEQKMREFDFIFRKCKLCMTQVISDRNGYSVILSTNSVKKMLNKKARLLTIPTLYFDLYFPQAYAGGKITINNFEFYGFGYGDCILEELHSKYNVDEIVEITKCDQLFSKSFMKWFEEYRYQELKKREEFWDVKIVDWIFERYKTERLFYSHNHPMLKVILRVVSGIMKELGYTWDARLVEYDKSFLAGHQELIYPSVKKSLGLEFEIPYYEENDVLGICDFEGAVRNRLSYIYERGIL